jgi:hypothetical protein
MVLTRPYDAIFESMYGLGEVDRRSQAYIRWVQQSLNQLDRAGLAVDGIAGPLTRNAVRAFQGRQGLVQDGVVGPLTEAALVRAGAPAPPGSGGGTTPTPTPNRPTTRVLCQPPPDLTTGERTPVALTSRFETGVSFGCVVSRTDGISMGMLQWNLLAGTLQSLLNRFEARTGRLRDFFGADTERVHRLRALTDTTSRDRARQLHRQAVDEAKAEGLSARWQDPLLRLCADPDFCGLMMADVRSYLRKPKTVARDFGLRTIRGLAMLFDVAVGDGLSDTKVAGFATRITGREAALGRRLTEREKLVEIANQAADVLSNYQEERRARRLLIANGTGTYRGSQWNIDREFPNLDDPWE